MGSSSSLNRVRQRVCPTNGTVQHRPHRFYSLSEERGFLPRFSTTTTSSCLVFFFFASPSSNISMISSQQQQRKPSIGFCCCVRYLSLPLSDFLSLSPVATSAHRVAAKQSEEEGPLFADACTRLLAGEVIVCWW